jgi:hypothetical protein
MLIRHPDWPSRLQSYLDSCRDTHFKYGQHDCCLFSCDCILATTGTDIAEPLRGKYHDRKGALAAIKERTGHSGIAAIAEYTAASFGMESIPVSMAQRGDMVLVGAGRKASLGIVSLTGADVMSLTNKQIVRVAFEHVTAAWRV